MRNYEITTILRSSGVEDTKNTVKELFAKNSVTVTAEEDWGSKPVWHEISKETTGHFSHYKCDVADPSVLVALENDFKLNQNILRSMIIRL